MTYRPDERIGGLAAVLAHPDDESFGCAGALALAHDAGRVTRLLVATRGEAGTADGNADEELAARREDELRCAASKIGFDEVTVLEGHADGSLADVPFNQLVDEIALWLSDRRPDAVITFGAHGVTGHPDHVVVGSATRWAVERLAESGIAPHAVYVIAPVFGPGRQRYDLSPEEGAASHRVDITSVAERRIAALECHASQPDAREEAATLRAALESEGVIYEGYTRVRPTVPAPHPKFDTALT
ncbi:MAG TPA: PIG-L family deacetylase [Candidatus Limnocylindria bacterium]|jgi:LmbE family N-acetylglucosaminyl deacetylase|nr:PIG-L family deacetylase [Candidatus Limnocylindria bacterium]